MADVLRLLFELDVDSRAGTAGLLRFRTDIAATIESVRRAVTQPLKSLNTAPLVAATTKAAVSTQELANRQTRATQAAQRLQIGQQRLVASSNQVAAAQQRAATAVQRAANGQTQAAAGAIRAATAYQRATIAANSFAQSQNAVSRAVAAAQSSLRGLGQGLQSVGRTLTVGVTAPLLALGAASLKSAKDIDANVNTLKAFTGSAESAEKRLAELIKTSRETPGLTTRLGLTLDAQLRVAQTTQETIDRVLPAIGRLNAVQKLADPSNFVRNLSQLVSQNFEKQDLKELVGQSPVAGQIIRELFNVDSPTNAAAIREAAQKMGLTTTEAFFTAFADAASRNQALATVTESIETRFDKIVDRVTVALRPLGLAIINAIEPFIEPVSKLIERLGEAFNSLSAPVKTAIIVIAGIAAAGGPVLFVLGGLVTAITGVVSAVGTIAAAVAAVGLPAIGAAVAGITILVAEWAVILGVLGLAWQKNFLNIRGLVSDAASAVVEAFGRIKAIFTEATERILPTLQSITTKVLAAITLVWERYGKVVVAVVGTAFRFIISVTETFLRNFTDFVDLVAKLIDGDWRGAWSAFARIVIRAVEQLEFVLQKLPALLTVAFVRLNQIIAAQGVLFAVAAQQLAVKFIAALAAGLVKGDRIIRQALIDMLVLAVQGLDPTSIAATMVARFLVALRKAAAEGGAVTVPVEFVPQDNLQRIELNPDGSLKTKKTPPSDTSTDKGGGGKGADTETRRRIRLLELESERAEAIAQQRISAENIHFDERRTSLKDFTDFQIKEEENVLAKKKAVFAAERAEAEKLGKGKDLALGENRLKELKAEIEFFDRRNQLLANQRREELEAAKAHRQALLDIQEQADAAELARLEDFVQHGDLTLFDLENRRAEIQEDAFRRRKAELDKQLEEAGVNKEEQGRILDEIKKLNQQHAEDVEKSERAIRDSLEATVEKYRQYRNFITGVILQTREVLREVARINLNDLSKTLGNERLIIEGRRRLALQEATDRHRENQLRIDDQEKAAEDEARAIGRLEARKAEIEKRFNQLRAAETRRAVAERKEIETEAQRERERADPNSTRSLFGETFANFTNAIRAAAAEAGTAISNLQVTLGGFGAAAAEHFANASAAAGNFISILLDGISQINDGLGDMLQNWILTGEVGSGALRKLLASTLAYYSRTFLIKALDNVGEGFSNLAKASAAAAAGNFFAAAAYKHAAVQNFISAAKYGIASAATAVAGRFAAGDSFKQRDTASRAVNGGEDPDPRNRTFNFGGQGPVETSSEAARDGSGGIFGRLVAHLEASEQRNLQAQRDQMLVNAQLAQAVGNLQGIPPEQVITRGAPGARATIGDVLIQHSNESGDFNENLTRNLGLT